MTEPFPFRIGEEINVVYGGYTVRGKVVDIRYRDWIVYETISCSRDGDAYAGMVVEAATEFCYRDGEPVPPDPFAAMLRSLGGLK